MHITTQYGKTAYITLTGHIRRQTDYALLDASNMNSTNVVFDFTTAESIDVFFIEVEL